MGKKKRGLNGIALQSELVKCGEVMFRPRRVLGDMDDSLVSVPQMVAQVVSKCDLDTRKELLSHIYLSGGVTTMPGFKERFDKELKETLPHSASMIKVNGNHRRFAVWQGGSILAGLTSFQQKGWEWKEDYEEKAKSFIPPPRPPPPRTKTGPFPINTSLNLTQTNEQGRTEELHFPDSGRDSDIEYDD